MHGPLFSQMPGPRPRVIGKRQMRERRTAAMLITFGLVLAAVELYVIIGAL